jgi:putative endonuclease
MPRTYYVYLLAGTARTLYVGVTNVLRRRIYEHQHQLLPGFTSKYNVNQLVHFEVTSDVHAALAREKEIKAWRRSNKIALIEATNPTWRDLSAGWETGQGDERP